MISITQLDYNKITVETLEDWLNLIGFHRRVRQYYIDFSKSNNPETEKHRQDLRDHGFEPDSYTPAGQFPGVILPENDMGEVMFLIREKELINIIEALKRNTIKKFNHPLTPWNWIVSIQNKRHPDWRIKPRSLFTTGLASEIGGVCDQVTHLDGGGSQQFDSEKWSEAKLLHDLIDSWVMIVLIAERSGFTESDFQSEWENVRHELIERAEVETT